MSSITGLDYTFPHCDPRVLHKPGECTYCDKDASDLQKIRKLWNINFTGHFEEGLLPCPADEARPNGDCEVWPNNRPDKINAKKRRDQNQKKKNKTSRLARLKNLFK